MAAHFLPKLPSTTQFSLPNTTTKHNPSSPSLKLPSLQNTWLIGTKVNVNVNNNSLFFHTSYLQPPLSKRHPIAAAVLSSLPNAGEANVVSTEKAPKWSWRAIKSFAMGELEARKLKYPNTGTEALLMGILVEGTSLAAKFLRANGVTLFKVCEEIIKLLGKGDMYFFSPEHPPLTEAVQKAIDWAVNQKRKSGASGEVAASHLLLGIWSEVDSPGHTILATLGFNDNKANELDSLISEPGVIDD